MDIRYTNNAVKDFELMTAELKATLKDAIEKLPVGRIRKLMDYSAAFRLQISGHCIIFEERPKKNQDAMTLLADRDKLYEMGVIYVAVHKVIPRPTISWIEEIEWVREGREDLKRKIFTKHSDMNW
jgi:hypothetical protein